jgi:hypothetical protein
MQNPIRREEAKAESPQSRLYSGLCSLKPRTLSAEGGLLHWEETYRSICLYLGK